MSDMTHDPALTASDAPAQNETSSEARTAAAIWSVLAVFVAAVVAAVSQWGLPALGLTALGLVPIFYAILIILANPGRKA